MTDDSSNARPDDDTPPLDYGSLRSELRSLTTDLVPVLDELFFRLDAHKHLWELHRFAAPDPYDGMAVSHITDHIIGAVKGVGMASLALVRAQARPTVTNRPVRQPLTSRGFDGAISRSRAEPPNRPSQCLMLTSPGPVLVVDTRRAPVDGCVQ